MKKKKNFKSRFDTNGSYTGTAKTKDDDLYPIQDADDL